MHKNGNHSLQKEEMSAAVWLHQTKMDSENYSNHYLLLKFLVFQKYQRMWKNRHPLVIAQNMNLHRILWNRLIKTLTKEFKMNNKAKINKIINHSNLRTPLQPKWAEKVQGNLIKYKRTDRNKLVTQPIQTRMKILTRISIWILRAKLISFPKIPRNKTQEKSYLN